MNDPTTIKLTSNSFNASAKGRYHLSIGLADGNSCCAVLDVSAKQYVALFKSNRPFGELFEAVLSELDPISVYAYVKGGAGTLVPVGSFSASQANDLLALTQSSRSENAVLHETVPALPIEVLYDPDHKNSELLKTHFPQAHILDARTVFLNGIARRSYMGTQLHLQVWQSGIDLAIFKNSELLLFNSHSFSSPEDVLYHCMFALDRTKQDRNQVKLSISGNGTRLEDLMAKYFESPIYTKGPDLLGIAPELNTRAYYLNHLLYERYQCA